MNQQSTRSGASGQKSLSDQPFSGRGLPAWDDPTILYPGDPPRRARYRLLQSWYREHELGVPAGYDVPTKKRAAHQYGNLLPVGADPTYNFLRDPRLEASAARRIKQATGAVSPDRLRRNLLSSQPLCFNLFGALDLYRDAAAPILAEVVNLDIEIVDEIRIEWAPTPAHNYLGDRTAFDAIVDYRDSRGRERCLTVETKYTESFSDDRFDGTRRDRYRAFARTTDAFGDDLDDDVFERATSQQCRNTLLALLHEKASGRVSISVVAACADDVDADAAVAGLNARLRPERAVRRVSFEHIVTTAASFPMLASWAEHFRQRYLDLSPVDQQP